MEKKVWIASHRGRFGENIVENTLPAFEAALRCGADIIETDLRRTRDGVMILFHDPTPLRLLDLPEPVEHYTLEELQRVTLRNAIGNVSGSRVNTLEELLTAMKGRCMINLDQCWRFIDAAYHAVAAHSMEEQALIKGRAPYDAVVSWLRGRDFVSSFIPVITCDAELEAFFALPKEVRIPQVEVFFRKEDARVISDGFVRQMADRGVRVWVNALDLGNGHDMCAGHNDTCSMALSPDAGWGWLVRRGVGVIQTDCPAELRRFLDSLGV